MEGLMPVLMRRGGARQVLATDFLDHCAAKMEAVKHYYSVDFEYKSVGLMYGLHAKLGRRNFDLINCSGLLYHVFSPMAVLAGVRPLLKRNGLMIVSTNVVLDDRYVMEFNNAGRMQEEIETYWYISVPLLDYLLRYLRLVPVDVLFWPHTDTFTAIRYVFDQPSAYLSVLCRATDNANEDEWMARSSRAAWEYQGHSDWKLADRQPVSSIRYKDNLPRDRIDLWEAVRTREPVPAVAPEMDSHTLRLSAFS
jgi:SAM-dependent methyltransferase